MLFYDMIVLNGYLFLNIVVGWKVLEAERNQVEPDFWVKPLVYISIPFAIGIHTVTAYLILWSARSRLLADRHPGPPFSGLCLCRGPGLS
jgi:hypothetical protein